MHYFRDGSARAAALGFWRGADGEAEVRYTARIPEVAPYAPGAFWRRELPCLRAVLARAAARHQVNLVIVDGHAWLREGEPGLGHHLWEALDRRTPVIGVAKAPYARGCAVPVTRGRSRRPLYVSAVGVDPGEAVDFVRRMHGPNRLPTLLAAVDALARRG